MIKQEDNTIPINLLNIFDSQKPKFLDLNCKCVDVDFTGKM